MGLRTLLSITLLQDERLQRLLLSPSSQEDAGEAKTNKATLRDLCACLSCMVC